MFDLDGTLADTLADIAAAGNHAMEAVGRPARALLDYRYLAGQGLEYLIEHAAQPPLSAAEVAQGKAAFRAYYAEHSLDQTRPYAGVPELLDALVATGVPMAVLSNKPHPATVQVIELLYHRWPWAAVRGHQEGVPLKPDPTSALQVAAEIGIEPARWAYVGDTKVDMATAVGAGFFPIGVTWGFRDEPELRDSGARHIAHHACELMQWLLPRCRGK